MKNNKILDDDRDHYSPKVMSVVLSNIAVDKVDLNYLDIRTIFFI